MTVTIQKISTPEDLQEAFEVRRKVFVIEQEVDEREEFDEFENNSIHFLAFYGGNVCGTARWRFTNNGVKLERFAVLPEARGQGVGQSLVAAVLQDIRQDVENSGKLLYLHAQLTAVPLYAKFGFKKHGEVFDECNILHQKMVLKL